MKKLFFLLLALNILVYIGMARYGDRLFPRTDRVGEADSWQHAAPVVHGADGGEEQAVDEAGSEPPAEAVAVIDLVADVDVPADPQSDTTAPSSAETTVAGDTDVSADTGQQRDEVMPHVPGAEAGRDGEPAPVGEEQLAEPPIVEAGDTEPEAKSGTPADASVEEPETKAEPVAAEPEGPGATDPVDEPAAPMPAECFSAGPFGSEQAAGKVITLLAEADIAASSRTTEEMEIKDYRVLILVENRAAATETLARIRQSGDSDVALIASGDNKGQVSVGVFAQRSNAETRKAQIGKLGFAPQVVPRGDVRSIWWVDWQAVPREHTPEDIIERAKADGITLDIQSRPCGDPAL